MQISEQCLKELPFGKFVRYTRTQNVVDEFVNAVVWQWIDERGGCCRQAAFDIDTGEYLGDML
jgi:hypothetical protein